MIGDAHADARPPRPIAWLARGMFGLWAITLTVLIVVATNSGSSIGLYVCLALYGAASLGWAAARSVFRLRTLTGETSGPAWLGSGLIVIGGGCLVVYGMDNSRDSLVVIGWVFIYAGLGWLVEGLRQAKKIRRYGVAVLLAGLLLVGAGAAVLGNNPHRFYLLALIVLALGGLLFVPVGLNLVSEAALRWQPEPGGLVFRHIRAPRSKILWGSAAIGLAGVAAAVMIAGLAAHAWLPAFLLASGGFVLMAAIVSDTHLDVTIVIAALCLLAVSPPSVPPPPNPPADGSHTLLALGDSYMSGEGAAAFYAGTDTPGVDTCRRSQTAYAPRSVETGLFDHLMFLACSGAVTANVILTPNGAKATGQPGEAGTQLDQLKTFRRDHPSFRPSLAIIAIGGNDAGFATLGEACLAPGNCGDIESKFTGNLPSVARALDATFSSVQEVLGDVPVVAVPYPQPIRSGGCTRLPFTTSEQRFIRTFADELNSIVKTAAQAHRFSYMDTMVTALANGRAQLCDRTPGIFPVALGGVDGIASQRFNPLTWLHNSLHPNALGHAKMLDAFKEWLNEHPISRQVAPGKPQPSAPSGAEARNLTLADRPPCSFATVGEANCSDQARNWEIGQIVQRWPWALVVLLGAVGSWLLSVVVIGGLTRSLRGRAAARQ